MYVPDGRHRVQVSVRVRSMWKSGSIAGCKQTELQFCRNAQQVLDGSTLGTWHASSYQYKE